MSQDQTIQIWRIYKHGHRFIFSKKDGTIPDYVELVPCPECGQARYRPVKLKLVGEWKGRLTRETGRWLAGVIKSGYVEVAPA